MNYKEFKILYSADKYRKMRGHALRFVRLLRMTQCSSGLVQYFFRFF